MRVMMVVPASEVRAEDWLFAVNESHVMAEPWIVHTVFTTGHGRVQFEGEERSVWFDSGALLCVLRGVS